MMKKRHFYIAALTICCLILLSGCGKKSSKNNHSYNNNPNYTPSTIPAQTTAAVPENAAKVSLSNLTITAGSEIDYMSAIESVENMELSKCMVSINSSDVDRFTPGTYTVHYTFDYMGQTVKSFIVVTVIENPETTTIETSTEIPTADTSNPSESSDETEESESSSTGEENNSEENPNETDTNETSSFEPNSENPSSENNTDALNSTVSHSNLPIPDAVFTLSTGETVTIKNTPERYIVETFTEDSYYTEDGANYLKSELKVLMNTGEVQTVEMVVTRVNSIPEESPSTT